MNYKYGNLTKDQVEKYRDKLHSKLFWLLLYKDPKTKDQYLNVDFSSYFDALMRELDGLNELLNSPIGLIEVMTALQAAYNESNNNDFNYKVYRKFVLDAHSLLDKICWSKEAE